MNDDLLHYGTPRHSGRYPWGSGENPFQSAQSLLGFIKEQEKAGKSQVEIANMLGLKTTQLRAQRKLAVAEDRSQKVAQAMKLKDKGWSNTAIGAKMGINESSVRSLLDPSIQARKDVSLNTANILKEQIAKNKYIDVGEGVEKHLGVSRETLKAAIEMLKFEGYGYHYSSVKQLGTGKDTSLLIMTEPGVTGKEVYANRHNVVMPVDNWSPDKGQTFNVVRPPENISSDRIFIRYGNSGGSDKDGVIEIRDGLTDLDLGNSRYAQVRIAVDGTHYMKGMAMRSTDIPKGYDVVYNTNKPEGTPPLGDKSNSVLKPQSSDTTNPFGAEIKAGGQRGALNILNEEGDWDRWSRNLASQFLSKQSPELIKQQLTLALSNRKADLQSILELNNPVIKKKLLQEFADEADSATVHLKAAALPRQVSQVILPFPDMSEKEVYAPNFRDGERVVLIRYPHGGIFEIPELTVNNRVPSAKKILSDSRDAIGINPKVAEQLSGADFDGDTVIVIPTDGKRIKTAPPLNELKNFDPKVSYPSYPGMKVITSQQKETEMGKVSNLITDMTLKGATEQEIARAVKHSMVVIDAEKHELNYKQSFEDNAIALLKTKYQGGANKGASTIISKASSQANPKEYTVGERRVNPETGKTRIEYIDPDTGKKLYTDTGNTYTTYTYVPPGTDKKVTSFIKPTDVPSGEVQEKIHVKTIKTTKMDEAFRVGKGAHDLVSGHAKEVLYADYANELNALANTARKEMISTPSIKYSPSAKIAYETEALSLMAKLNVAEKNAPLERKAQVTANYIVQQKKEATPEIKDDAKLLKKVQSQALNDARELVGAKKELIIPTDKEWEAIQAGAISNSALTKIVNNSDSARIKELATPKEKATLSPTKISQIKALQNSGYTQREIADHLGVSITTVQNALG